MLLYGDKKAVRQACTYPTSPSVKKRRHARAAAAPIDVRQIKGKTEHL
jgi:hypothetical protein